MSIKTKLILSFSAIVVINICFGLYTISSLSAMSRRVIEADEWTEGISEVGDMHFAVVSLRGFDLSKGQILRDLPL
jgi:hypothetical protein